MLTEHFLTNIVAWIKIDGGLLSLLHLTMFHCLWLLSGRGVIHPSFRTYRPSRQDWSLYLFLPEERRGPAALRRKQSSMCFTNELFKSTKASKQQQKTGSVVVWLTEALRRKHIIFCIHSCIKYFLNINSMHLILSPSRVSHSDELVFPQPMISSSHQARML